MNCSCGWCVSSIRPGLTPTTARPVRAPTAASERSRPRYTSSVGGLEPRRLLRVPQRGAAVLLGVRLPGTAELAHAQDWVHPSGAGPLTKDRSGLPRAPEGGRRQRQTRPRDVAAPRRTGRLHRLALGDAAQPGASCCLRHRTLPVLVAADGGLDRLAAERLLAGHLLGRDRLRGATQTAVVRAAGRVCAAVC